MMEGPRHQHLHQEWQEPPEEPGYGSHARSWRANRDVDVRRWFLGVLFGGALAGSVARRPLRGRKKKSKCLSSSLLFGLSCRSPITSQIPLPTK